MTRDFVHLKYDLLEKLENAAEYPGPTIEEVLDEFFEEKVEMVGYDCTFHKEEIQSLTATDLEELIEIKKRTALFEITKYLSENGLVFVDRQKQINGDISIRYDIFSLKTGVKK